MERKLYPSLDIVKFIMALSILGGHIANEWAHSTGLVHFAWGAGNFAVPFFFACSGFLFFAKLNTLDYESQKDYYKKWSIRVGKMYLVWSLIYFCFYFFGDWMILGFPQEKILRWCHRSLVFSTYSTIWFLPALWGGVSICYFLKKYCSNTVFVLIILLLLLLGNTFGAYCNVVTKWGDGIKSFYDTYMDIFFTWRNATFHGAPYVAIGLLAIKIVENNIISFRKSFYLCSLFCICYLIEGYLIVIYKFSHATHQGFMMAPAIFFMMIMLVQWNVSPKPIWQHCRNLSMLIFLDQRLFLSAIPSVLPQSYSDSILKWPEPYIYLYFAVSVIAFSILIERLSTKYKFLKLLW